MSDLRKITAENLISDYKKIKIESEQKAFAQAISMMYIFNYISEQIWTKIYNYVEKANIEGFANNDYLNERGNENDRKENNN